jgi:hypothetical protein
MSDLKPINFPGNLIGPNKSNTYKLEQNTKMKLRMHNLDRKACELFGLYYKKIRREK